MKSTRLVASENANIISNFNVVGGGGVEVGRGGALWRWHAPRQC